MTRTHPFQTVDAFTSTPFAGNPAAVIRFSSSLKDQTLAKDDDLMQKIATEFNLAETAFCRWLGDEEEAEGSREEDESPEYEIRWRTPTLEVPLCGHATLASAHVLFTTYHPLSTSLTFLTLHSGTLRAVRNSSDNSISLDFPAASLLTLEEGHRRRPKIVEAVKAATGLGEDQVGKVAWWDAWNGAVVELDAGVDLENLKVDIAATATVGDILLLTQPAPSSSGFDIYSRVFARPVGIDEDPVTGAAHTALAVFYLLDPSTASRLPHSSRALSSSTLRAKQVSKRGGEIVVALDKEKKRVELRGHARTVMRGEIEL
ncbi:phenazine biosynthesis PhzC/PhzF family protein [Rhodotorula toruloides]|uniref:Phenazine biosynthesis PhzC/PhzF family protein n=1 Tax=Rhodotorula toruloides TaxID=5286 RepID=A0A511KK49_RHOTO|nr:phenazine biosynthesis PhzC/PhzF family protein [Rhodotorula toruloides]